MVDDERQSGIFGWDNTPWINDARNSGDKFYVGDFDGDGKDDIAIRRVDGANSRFWLVKSTGTGFNAQVRKL